MWRRVSCAGSFPFALTLGLVLNGWPVTVAQRATAPAFADKTAEVGLDFVHVSGATGALHLPEVIGAGGAVFDFDNDGDLDILAVQSGSLPPDGLRRIGSSTRLFRNDLSAGRQRFTDVTGRSGLATSGYGMAAATGDVDNDGWVDLYVTGLGASQLFRNNRDGTFADVTGNAGVGDTRWSVGATFVDYDGDGWLDLFVVRYVNFRVDMKRGCFSATSARDYCNPAVYDPVPDRLFHNNQNGTFTDVTARAGIGSTPARGLGVLAFDADDDGWTDLYVANDGDPNRLWLNEKGSGRFTDGALLAGVAVSRAGLAQGSMGVDAADVDEDGDDDLFVTNLDNEGNTFYRNTGKGLFEDRTVEAGLSRLGFTGFGTRFFDYDNDGWLDLVVANGAVRHMARQQQEGDPYPLKQSSHLFRGEGGRRFVDVSTTAGSVLTTPAVARGVAAGDLDNDGDADLVVFVNNGRARVLVNQSGAARHWLGVRVMAERGQRDALGAVVEIVRTGGGRRRRTVRVDGSYASSSDPRVVFGLGDVSVAQAVRVRWPGGVVEEFRGLGVDRYWVLEAGRAPRTM